MKNNLVKIIVFAAGLSFAIGGYFTSVPIKHVQALGLCENVGTPGITVDMLGSSFTGSATVQVDMGTVINFTVHTYAEPSSFNNISYPGGSFTYPGPSSAGRSYTTSPINSTGYINVYVLQNCDATNAEPADFTLTININIKPPTVDIKANGSDNPPPIAYNSPATLSWTSTNATSCSASNGWSGGKATSGSESTGNLTAGRTYTITCNGPGGSASDSVTVNVTAAATYTLTVNSSGTTGVAISSSTGHGGTTNYSRSGLSGSTTATLTAPATSGSYTFSSWSGCSSVSGNTCTIGMGNANQTVTANYLVTLASQCVSHTIPSTMSTGQSLPVSVTMRNVGASAWVPPNDYLILVGWNGANSAWSPYSVPLPTSPIATNQNVTFSFNLVAPATPGTYSILYRMIRLGVTEYNPSCGGNVTVSAANGTIYVTSNVSTSWTIGGTAAFSGSGLNNGSGYTAPQGSYTISPSALTCYTLAVTPSSTQSLAAGGSITFTLTYTYNCGTVAVSSPDIPSSWYITGPSNFCSAGSPCSGSSGSYPSALLGSYTIQGVPSSLVYSGNTYQLSSVTPGYTQSLSSPNTTITFTIRYTLQPPTPPGLPSLDNSVCRRVTISWSDNSNNEAGFQVWRSTSSSGPVAAPNWTNISGNLAAGTTSYTDTTGAINTNYYYAVKAYLMSPAYAESVSGISSAVQFIQCTPNISNSSKRIYEINGVSFDPSMKISNGDRITFQFTIINSNTATDTATISGISPDNFTSDNLAQPSSCPSGGSGAWCLKIDKNGNGVFNEAGEAGSITVNGAGNISINVSGTMAPGTNWLIRFDAMAQVSGTVGTLFRNVGVINCQGVNYGENCTVTRGVSFLNNTSGAKVPQFREIAP